MPLQELSAGYAAAARLLRERLQLLRRQLRQSTDPDECLALTRRIAAMTPILTEMNALAELTAHYYDRGYRRNADYTL